MNRDASMTTEIQSPQPAQAATGKEYAVELFDCCGVKRHWSAAYPTAKLACDAARAMLKERNLGYRALVSIRDTPAGWNVGATWRPFRAIRN